MVAETKLEEVGLTFRGVNSSCTFDFVRYHHSKMRSVQVRYYIMTDKQQKREESHLAPGSVVSRLDKFEISSCITTGAATSR